jgi:hypothetical protein
VPDLRLFGRDQLGDKPRRRQVGTDGKVVSLRQVVEVCLDALQRDQVVRAHR